MRASLQPKRTGFLQPEEKALRKPYSSFLVPKGDQESWRRLQAVWTIGRREAGIK